MAIVTVNHGDLVLVHANSMDVHGLFTVDTADDKTAVVRPPDGSAPARVRLADICAVYAATSIM